MQTMPTRTRTSLVIGAVAALVLVVSLALYAVNQRAQNQPDPTNPLAEIAEPENGTPLNANSAANAAPNTGAQANPDEVNAAAGETPVTGGETEVNADAASPAMTTLEAVPATHIVQPNETLYDISEKYYNTHIYAGDIEALNGLEDPNQITVGMELKLPQPSELAGFGQ